ncbi:MAG: RNA polymerase sigma factor [Lachnospiraceae bacterium]|nr:RNA polymerase sigma factor [Lachnospiraceae bacterium]
MRVYSYVVTLTGKQYIAEEITQETFYRAFTAKNTFRGESSAMTWLCTIAKNLFFDEKRRQSKNVETEPDTNVDSGINIEREIEDKDASYRIHHQADFFKRKSAIAGTAIAGIFMIPVLVCLIVNLTIGAALDWFFIVLASLIVAASLIVVPLVMPENKFLWTLVQPASAFRSYLYLYTRNLVFRCLDIGSARILGMLSSVCGLYKTAQNLARQ